MDDCLFRSHLLDAIGDTTKGASDFFLSGGAHTCSRSCIILIRYNHACTWMEVIKKGELYNKAKNSNESII